jgi:hypothetical protein
MIKKYLQFLSLIKENKNNIEDLYLKDEYIKEFFVELELDNNFLIDIQKGVFYERNIYGKNKIDFYKKIPSGKVKIAYEIFIECPSKWEKDLNKDDLTDEFVNSILRIADFTNMDFYLETDDYRKLKINIDNIEVSNTTFNLKGEMHPYTKSITLYLYEKEYKNITDIQIAEYYEWYYDFKDDNDNIYIKYYFKELVDIFLSQKCISYKLLTNHEDIYDHYYYVEYIPDLDSLFKYYLDKENKYILIKKLIDNNGGYKVVSNIFDFEDYTEEQTIEYLVKKPSELKKLSDINLIEEIQDLYASYALDAHTEQNIKDAEREFFRKLENEVKIVYDKNNEGETVYMIKFDPEWYLDLKYDDFNDISDIMHEWMHKYGIRFEIDPYFSDHGNFDEKEFNKEVKSILSR